MRPFQFNGMKIRLGRALGGRGRLAPSKFLSFAPTAPLDVFINEKAQGKGRNRRKHNYM